MRHARLSLVLVALVLFVTACSSDSDDATTTTQAPTEETTTTQGETTTTQEETTTTQGVATTTTAAADWAGLPNANPRSVANTDGIDPYVPIDLSPYTGLDRCAWTSSGDDAHEAECATMARQAQRADTMGEYIVADSPTRIRGSDPAPGDPTDWVEPDHLCFIDEDEIVTPANEDEVINTLLGAEQPSAAVEEEAPPAILLEAKSERLPAGLLAYQVHDPIAATTALVDAGIPASPRYVLMPSARWKFGPAGPALPADPAVENSQGTLTNGPGATIVVIDTGPVNGELDGTSAAIRGHGQFIAGVIRRLLPGATIVELSALVGNGTAPPVATERSVVEHLQDLFDPPDEALDGAVVNLSLGTYACSTRQVPLQLAARLGEMVEDGIDVAVVAAAGNDESKDDDPAFFPAGFSEPALYQEAVELWERLSDYPELASAIDALQGQPNVIGVGALVRTANEDRWMPAVFSNQVAATVWAPGANIVSSYPEWDGVAQWDGTSFAAPHVAAVIAECGGLSGNYRDALEQVKQNGYCSP